jgi:hypothetical protein
MDKVQKYNSFKMIRGFPNEMGMLIITQGEVLSHIRESYQQLIV